MYQNPLDFVEQLFSDDRIGGNPQTGEDQIRWEIVRSIPADRKAFLSDSLKQFVRTSHDCPQRYYEAVALLESSLTPYVPAPAPAPNEPVGRLLRLFLDRRSGKVIRARKELQRRFSMQSRVDQTRILRAFLRSGCRNDVQWAGRQLASMWIPSLADDLKQAWERFHEVSTGRAVLKYLPGEYAVSQVDELYRSGVSKGRLCAVLGDVEGFPFEISPRTLVCPDYLYAMAKLGRNVEDADAGNLVWKYISLACHVLGDDAPVQTDIPIPDPMRLLQYSSYTTHTGLMYHIPGMEIIIWALGHLGCTDTLLEMLWFFREMDRLKCSESTYADIVAFAIDNGMRPEKALEALSEMNDDTAAGSAAESVEHDSIPYDDFLVNLEVGENFRDYVEGLDLVPGRR